MRAILPNAANEVISLFKSTSIVSTMAIGELFYQVQVIYGRNGRVVPLLMVATVWYIVLTTLLSSSSTTSSGTTPRVRSGTCR